MNPNFHYQKKAKEWVGSTAEHMEIQFYGMRIESLYVSSLGQRGVVIEKCDFFSKYMLSLFRFVLK